MWYKVDYDKLILLLLPTFWRKPKLFAYLKALISPIASLYYSWDLERTENIISLSYNSQKCYLQKALNDYHDKAQRRIIIKNTVFVPSKYIYLPQENLPVYLGKMYLDQDFITGTNAVDFIVTIPQALENEKPKIEATIEKYALAGKSYEIVIF